MTVYDKTYFTALSRHGLADFTVYFLFHGDFKLKRGLSVKCFSGSCYRSSVRERNPPLQQIYIRAIFLQINTNFTYSHHCENAPLCGRNCAACSF